MNFVHSKQPDDASARPAELTDADTALTRFIAQRDAPSDAGFAISGGGAPGSGLTLAKQIGKAFAMAGHPSVDPECARVVLHVVDAANPRPFRRQSRRTFVVAIVALNGTPDDPLGAGYPFLVRALANLCIVIAEDAPSVAHVITLEQGHYEVPLGSGQNDVGRLYEHLQPLALSRLVIDHNRLADLPKALWGGDAHTDALARAGQQLAALNLLPAPFPLERYLAPRDLRHVRHLYGIGGLSYGNMSIRHDAEAFWMTASGVNKGRLSTVGRDILLIRGLDRKRLALQVSVPETLAGRVGRPSVDAIEHWMIYRQHPEVGAIVHVHAWIDGVSATQINYPCGTIELASAVADLVGMAPDPAGATVGQKNHGMTLTGRTLDGVMARLADGLSHCVPMAA